MLRKGGIWTPQFLADIICEQSLKCLLGGRDCSGSGIGGDGGGGGGGGCLVLVVMLA